VPEGPKNFKIPISWLDKSHSGFNPDYLAGQHFLGQFSRAICLSKYYNGLTFAIGKYVVEKSSLRKNPSTRQFESPLK
jgi:hypothetical protein